MQLSVVMLWVHHVRRLHLPRDATAETVSVLLTTVILAIEMLLLFIEQING